MRQEEFSSIEADISLTLEEKAILKDNVVIHLAFEKFERVNKGNDINKFIDLTC